MSLEIIRPLGNWVYLGLLGLLLLTLRVGHGTDGHGGAERGGPHWVCPLSPETMAPASQWFCRSADWQWASPPRYVDAEGSMRKEEHDGESH